MRDIVFKFISIMALPLLSRAVPIYTVYSGVVIAAQFTSFFLKYAKIRHIRLTTVRHSDQVTGKLLTVFDQLSLTIHTEFNTRKYTRMHVRIASYLDDTQLVHVQLLHCAYMYIQDRQKRLSIANYSTYDGSGGSGVDPVTPEPETLPFKEQVTISL